MANDGQERWTREEARRVLDECARSGLSVEAFARQRGLRSKRLLRWRTRLGLPKLTRGRRPAPPRFAPVIALPSPRTSGLTLRVGDDVALRFEDASTVDPSWLAALLRELRGC
jgi:transposase-like protein